ncbi:hypothetical protein E8E13_007727 [Curvularia kusanoi]|uniref:PD-(D/E)XK nuclease-like domain-containing protein n=1 Tax=Curvularia kusanoi TaxID=90978 RepID=A0A9P4WB58_CURKU|nr:hypothetical protein E8E13_007727 [Curvularia kusanoi]
MTESPPNLAALSKERSPTRSEQRHTVIKWIHDTPDEFPDGQEEERLREAQSDELSFDTFHHLRFLDGGPREMKTYQSEKGYPIWLQDLHSRLEDISTQTRFIPRCLGEDPEIKTHFPDVPLDKLDYLFTITESSLRTEESGMRGVHKLIKISDLVQGTWTMERWGASKSSWDSQVHCPMLQQLDLHGESCVGCVRQQRAQAEYLPTHNGKPIDYGHIDFAVLWSWLQDEEDRIWDLLSAPINHDVTPDLRYTYRPMVLPIENRVQEDHPDDASVKLILWVMSQFKRFREISGHDRCSFPTPMLQAYGAKWYLLFAVDGRPLEVFNYGLIGSTSTLLEAYRLLESLRAILKWVSDTYLLKFREEILSSARRWYDT